MYVKYNTLHFKIQALFLELEEPESFASDEEIPMVPFKQLVPNPNDYAVEFEGYLY